MFDLTQINFEAKEDPIKLFAYLRLIIEAFNENIYDSLTYTIKEKGLSASVTISHDQFSAPLDCAVELFEKPESKQLVLLISRE
jgi:hypothetical protein